MAIETFDDVLEDLLDRMGIYGSHNPQQLEDYDDENCKCRVCMREYFRERIEAALAIEEQLERGARR
jgi:queuine/archaeosine tRNA-ribosyltransferase